MRAGKSRSVRVRMLARVEGEGGLQVRIRDGAVADVRLDIFESPRLFEAFLRGRAYTDLADFVARICGICPAAHQLTAVQAVERAFGVEVPRAVRVLRRLLYCGEWIESHALHVFMLHAPDFLGYESGLHMAKDHPDMVTRGLQLKKTGNALMARIGGREIHPVNVRTGGFWRMPRREELQPLADSLEWGREEARQAVQWVAGFDFPDFRRDVEFVALRHPDEYAIGEGRIVSTAGIDLDAGEYENVFVEEHLRHSNALHSRIAGRGHYATGPVARWNLNGDRLSPAALDAAREAGLERPCLNPFRSIVVRAVELYWAFDEALRLLAAYEPSGADWLAAVPRAARGTAATEAPRGLLYHRYELGADGTIRDARIVPPTSQNLGMMEDDLADLVGRNLALDDPALTWKCEQAVRNYDPCISCATHFLKLDLRRE